MKKLIPFAVLLVLAASRLAAQTEEKPAKAPVKPATPPTHADVVYGPSDRNVLDIWLANSSKPTPLVVFIHGGGWHGGDKTDVTDRFLKAMLDQDVSVASIRYRLTPENILPAPVYDAARALQFLRSKAGEWNLDPRHVGLTGISAGGCTSLWLACHDDLADPKSSDPVLRESTRVQVAAVGSPQTSLDPDVVIPWIGPQVMNHGMIRRAVNARTLEDIKAKPELLKLLQEFSPINHLSADDPPILITYPEAGPLPAPNAGAAIHNAIFGVKFKEKADAAGVTCILKIEKEPAAATLPTIEGFLLKYLK